MKLTHADRIRATVCYADIFDFPLTREELLSWQIGKGVLPRTFGQYIQSSIYHAQRYFFLSRRAAIVKKRTERQKWAQEKWSVAWRVSTWLQYIPTIELVGVTGGLAMNNAKKTDDVDLFFIVQNNTVWTSRLLATVLVELLGLRRHPQEKNVANKICLNMFMTDDALSLPKKERDLFSAHEVLQMQPLWVRNDAYRKFLTANLWVKKFLPNAWKEKYQGASIKYQGENGLSVFSLLLAACTLPLFLLEPFARVVQLWYMRNHRTTEVVTDHVLRFHPKDARIWIRSELAKRLHRYNVPLDNIFYGR